MEIGGIKMIWREVKYKTKSGQIMSFFTWTHPDWIQPSLDEVE